jgi:hypothetical protein
MGESSDTKSAESVAEALRGATGLGFAGTPSKTLPLIEGSITVASVEPSEAAMERFGDVTIVVYTEPIAPEPAGSDRISWEFWPADHGSEAAWHATTYYGNVRLLWVNTRREVDDRWRELDRALRECCGS